MNGFEDLVNGGMEAIEELECFVATNYKYKRLS